MSGWFFHVIETLFGLGLFINALVFVPQAVRIWRTQKTDGVSLVTFGGFILIQIVSILHGILRHDYILAIGMALSVVTCSTVIIAYLWVRYRQRNAEAA